MEVSGSESPKDNRDIARMLAGRSSRHKYDKIVKLLNERDNIVLHMVQKGCSIQTGCTKITPRVIGEWAEEEPDQYKVTVDVLPTSEMREALGEVAVEVQGVKKGRVAHISSVTDTFTKRSDGCITPDKDLLIEGDLIRVSSEMGEGVFFIDSQGNSTVVSQPITMNFIKKVLVRVPPLKSGSYTLRIVTRSAGNSVPLKEPRVIEYSYPLTVQ